MQLSISPDGRFAFSYGVYSTSTNQKLIVTDISSATKQASVLDHMFRSNVDENLQSFLA